MASVPLLGENLGFGQEPGASVKSETLHASDPLRLGIIGYGNRGEELVSCLASENSASDQVLEIRGISEVHEQRMEQGLLAAGPKASAYKNYLDLLNSSDIDAVIIATPDHWHATMAMEAARRGKHIYLETCMALSLEEAQLVKDAVIKSSVAFQLGHQGRQRDLNLKAKELIASDTLGKITLIETTTNRNDPSDGHEIKTGELASAAIIDWDLFQGPSGDGKDFSWDRYYGWRNYWAYGNGMAGDLLTNEFDLINSILELGIPESVIASGGLYYHRDGREVPDVFQAAFEYPRRALSLLYSGTLASSIPRGTLFMGNDATLELGRILSVWADKKSIKYKSRIQAGIIDPAAPFVSYMSEEHPVDAISSATSKYYADRGLVKTYRDGAEVSTTQLHLSEWLSSIRTGRPTSCNIHRGFEEAVTAHMAVRSYLEGRKIRWDKESETLI